MTEKETSESKKRRRGHGEGAIYQRASDGRWTSALIMPSGKRKYLYGQSRKEVAEKLKAAQRSSDDGLELEAGRLTVAKYLEKWLALSVKPSVKVKTYEGYESITRVRVAPRIGSKKLAKLTPLDLQNLYDELDKAGLSARSVHHTHRVLHRAFVQAMRWNLIARNPCDGVTPPTAKRTEMRALSPEQAIAFLAATADHPAHALYVLAITTGMRQGELLALRWKDVDLDAGKLAVRQALQRQRGNGLVFVEPKTARSRRTIKLGKRAVDALRRQSDLQAFARRTAGSEWQDNGLVFCDGFGKPLDPSYQTAVFKAVLRGMAEAAKKADEPPFPVIRFHDLRHTAATILLAKGVHVKLVSEMLGHSTIVLTLDTYSHLIPAMHDDAAAAMDAVLAG